MLTLPLRLPAALGPQTASEPVGGGNASSGLSIGGFSLSASGEVAVRGSAALTVGALSLSATGVSSHAAHSGTLLIGAFTVAGAGQVPVSGSGALTIGRVIVLGRQSNVVRVDGAGHLHFRVGIGL